MTRRTSEELRSLMIDAGCELVRRRGLAFDPASLTYANVFEHLEQTRNVKLHRSQVHGRIWANQDAFRLDVVLSTIADTLPGAAEMDQLLAELTAERDTDDLRTIVDAWVEASLEATLDHAGSDRQYDLYVAAQALSAWSPATSERIREAVRTSLLHRMARNEARYRAVMQRLGAEVDDNIGIERDDAYRLLTRNSSALIEGTRLLEIIDEDVTRPFDINGTSSEKPEKKSAMVLALILMTEELFGVTPDSDETDSGTTNSER